MALGDDTRNVARQRGMRFPPMLWANLPPAAAYAGMSYFCADTPSGSSLVVSDGTKWRIFARNVFSKRIVLTADMGGVATFTYGTDYIYTSLPTTIVTLGDVVSKMGKIQHYVQEESMTGCKVKIERGRALSGLVTNLIGFDPWIGGDTTGIIVNLVVFPNS